MPINLANQRVRVAEASCSIKALISIVIPAYNAKTSISYTSQWASAPAWSRKEIIVVSDGSHDGTRGGRQFRFERGCSGILTEPRGRAALNHAFDLSRGKLIKRLMQVIFWSRTGSSNNL